MSRSTRTAGRTRRASALGALLLSVSALAGCGLASDSEGNEESQAGSADDLPDCSEVWVDGETLDPEYSGCVVDGQPDLLSPQECESGDRLVTYEDSYFALLGGEITEASTSSSEYAAVLEECTGESS